MSRSNGASTLPGLPHREEEGPVNQEPIRPRPEFLRSQKQALAQSQHRVQDDSCRRNPTRQRTTGLRSLGIPSILSGHHCTTAARLSLFRSDPSGRDPACPPNGPLIMKTKNQLCRALPLWGIATTILAASLFAATRVRQQEPTTKTQTSAVGDEMVTRQAVCRWASKPPVLDGKLDDPCWQQAKVIDHFAAYWNKTPRSGTRAFLVWDDEAIYYAGSMTDAEVRAFGTHRNDTLWDGDVFELFLKPSARATGILRVSG